MELANKLHEIINAKTKPIGSLGTLEALAMQIGLIQNTVSPTLSNPHILIFAADHGIADSGVSAYPKDVTWQMVLNFLQEGAAINVFSKQNDIAVTVVDAGVDKDFGKQEKLIDAKVAYGTRNILYEPAMTVEQLVLCKKKARDIVTNIVSHNQCNVIGFGEMGIGNTSAAAMVMHSLTGIELDACTGTGTGLDKTQLAQKRSILRQAIHNHTIDNKNANEVLQTFGGFEIVMMSEGMLTAAALGCIILVDGFISTAAYLAAFTINPAIKANAIFAHQSDENGHQFLLNFLDASPLLNLHMRLGEGTGCAVAYPVIKAAVNFLNQMASFESASISNKA